MDPISHDDVFHRDLYAVNLVSLASPLPAVDVSSPFFVCLWAGDFRNQSVADLSMLAQHLLDSGACYFVCWGPDCKRAHDIIDETLYERDPDCTDSSIVLTTWHNDEPLTEALFYFLSVTHPADDYIDGDRASLAITIQDEALLAQITDALTEPHAFIRSVLDD